MDPRFAIVVVFAVTLFISLLLSELASRSILSTAVIFLAAGILCGRGGLHFIAIAPETPLLRITADLALVAILFTDAMRIGARDLLSAWKLPGRALILGMPLTGLITAVLAVVTMDIAWPYAALIAAALAPTDPVFSAAIVGRQEIPSRLRHLLNVESGINDGLALPVVLGIMAFIVHQHPDYGRLAIELAGGIVLGILIPWIAVRIESLRAFAVATQYEPLFAFSIGVLVFAISGALHLNTYLASFAAGVTMATIAPERREEFARFGELIAELLKLLAVLLFGALFSSTLLADAGPGAIVFAVATLLVARPAALALILWRSELSWLERAIAGWFGPKGFASVVYAVLIVSAKTAATDRVFNIIAVAIAISMIAHSSTDVPVAHWFRRKAVNAQ